MMDEKTMFTMDATLRRVQKTRSMMDELRECPACGGEAACHGDDMSGYQYQCAHNEDCQMAGPVGNLVFLARERWNALPRRSDFERVTELALTSDLREACEIMESLIDLYVLPAHGRTVKIARAFIEKHKEKP